MKKGINIWSFRGGLTAREYIEMAKDAGYDGIEFGLDETGIVGLDSSDEDIRELKRIAEGEGIETPSLATGLYWRYPFTSSDRNTREKAKSIVRRQLDLAALLGADTILVVPGLVGADFIPDGEVTEYDVAYDLALEAFMELKEYAEEVKVNIGLENVWNKFLLSPLEMRDFVDKIDSPYVGVYFDVGNVVSTGYPEHWIKILGKRIKKVHFKDFRVSVGNINGFVDLLSGDVNYPAVMEQFRKVGYDDYVIAEMGVYKNYPDQTIYTTSIAMDRILGL
ncbi:MAG: sugar phosphate isomerase/epimerase family protein [Caldicoprobacterales bacterium]|nr:sugar phosphate isomerase/epimerase [Clostridiales bacterium]